MTIERVRELMSNSGITPEEGIYTINKDGNAYINAKVLKALGGVEPMVRRLIAIWLDLPDHYKGIGWHWYDEVHNFAEMVADAYDLSIWQVAQVIAALSPQNPWDGSKGRDGNRLCTLRVIDAYFSGGVEAVKGLRGWGYAGEFTSKAIKALSGVEIDWSGAPKTHRFALLIADPTRTDIAVMDTHASRIATGNLGNRYHVVSTNGYPILEESYMQAAEILGIPAYVLQAGPWQAAADGELYI